MGRNFFTFPGETDLYLFPDEFGEQFYITVKNRLTFAESEALKGASLTSLHFNANREEGESEIGLDLKGGAIKRMQTWIISWNLTDHSGKVLAFSKSAIENLDPEVAEEISRVIDEHVKAQEGKGRTPTIALVSETTSTS